MEELTKEETLAIVRISTQQDPSCTSHALTMIIVSRHDR